MLIPVTVELGNTTSILPFITTKILHRTFIDAIQLEKPSKPLSTLADAYFISFGSCKEVVRTLPTALLYSVLMCKYISRSLFFAF